MLKVLNGTEMAFLLWIPHTFPDYFCRSVYLLNLGFIQYNFPSSSTIITSSIFLFSAQKNNNNKNATRLKNDYVEIFFPLPHSCQTLSSQTCLFCSRWMFVYLYCGEIPSVTHLWTPSVIKIAYTFPSSQSPPLHPHICLK